MILSYLFTLLKLISRHRQKKMTLHVCVFNFFWIWCVCLTSRQTNQRNMMLLLDQVATKLALIEQDLERSEEKVELSERFVKHFCFPLFYDYCIDWLTICHSLSSNSTVMLRSDYFYFFKSKSSPALLNETTSRECMGEFVVCSM